ncbi:hypothetical protein DV737_g1234, partial [Chaetothyriales sp. CBS 132003]
MERDIPQGEAPTSSQSRVTAEGTRNSNSVFGPKTLSYRDAELLMHYLDHVFPRQFRFHTEDINRRGGRGWLLWLLTQTGPLYHAALSLSALHQFILYSHEHGHKYTELNEYHTNALRDLRVFLQLNNQGSEGTDARSGQIEVLACGVSLISFELYRGGVSDWQPHLSALASIVTALEHDPSIACTKRLPETPSKPTQESPQESPKMEDSAIPFLVAVVLWFDLVSCASIGTAPRLPYKALIWNQGIDLERIMGCQNWVMTAIGDSAALNAWKKHAQHTGTLDVGDLVARSQVIEHQLEQGLATLESSHPLEVTNGPPHSHAVSTISRRVTRVFASAALVQLHTFVSGSFPNHPKVRSSVDRTISALEQIADAQDVRGLIWPTVHSIIDSTFVSHVSFIGTDEDGEPTPMMLPLTTVLGNYGDGSSIGPERSDEELDRHQKHTMKQGPMNVYLHGNAAAMLCKAIRASETVDGLILYPTPNGHSLNYRSASIHGLASLIPDSDIRKKEWAMRLLTNHMFQGRWENTYPVAPSAVEVVKVIEVQIRSASAKIRTGDTGSFDAGVVKEQDRLDMLQAGKGVWSGILPLFEVLGTPVKTRSLESLEPSHS